MKEAVHHRSSLGSPACKRSAVGRLSVALSAGVIALGVASTASAGTITFNKTKMLPARSDTRSDVSFLYTISKSDCDNKIDFPFSVTFDAVATGQQLEVWASDGSANCEAYSARYGATKICTQLASIPINISSKELIWTPTADVIANAHTSVDACTIDDPTPLQITLTFLVIDTSNATGDPISVAEWKDTKIQLRAPDPPPVNDITTGESNITVSFTKPDTTTQGYIQKYYLFCDPPPASAATSGCGCLNAGLTSGTTTTTSTTTTTDTTSTTDTAVPPPPETGAAGGWEQPPPGGGTGGTGGMTGGTGGMTGGTGGMTGGTGGMTGGTTAGGGTGATGATSTGGGGSGGDTSTCTITEHTPASCHSCYFTAGDPAPGVTSKYVCGTSDPTADSVGTTSALDNNRDYAVALAVLDKVGNMSVLSELKCGTPAEVTDFYESYRGRGGAAGGGTCAMRPAMRDPNYLAPAGIGVALMLLGGRRAARRRKGRKDDTTTSRTAKDEAAE